MTDTSTAAPAAQLPQDARSFTRFADFYPFYLSEHSNRTCRWLHFVDSALTLVCLAMPVVTGKLQYLLYALLCGYGFAWVGHFGFEKKARQFQASALQLYGRLVHAQGYLVG